MPFAIYQHYFSKLNGRYSFNVGTDNVILILNLYNRFIQMHKKNKNIYNSVISSTLTQIHFGCIHLLKKTQIKSIFSAFKESMTIIFYLKSRSLIFNKS